MLLQSLDTFIGRITVLLILSLIVSALGEGVSNVVNVKGGVLEQSINTLVEKRLSKLIFEHPTIRRLGKAGFLGRWLKPFAFADDQVVEIGFRTHL